MLTPLACRVISRILSLKRVQSLRSNRSSDLWAVCKTKPEELSLLRSRHRALGLIYLELEPLSDESRNALHHPVTRTFTAHIDIAVICVANMSVSPALQLAVEFVEHDVAEQWRKRTSLGESLPRLG